MNAHVYCNEFGNQEDEELTTIILDVYIGSKTLTNMYREVSLWNSQLIDFQQYCQLFKGALQSHKKPKLLYRASRDGFSHTQFHKHCDDHLKTVTIIKTTTGDLFGGYTTQNFKLDERGSNVPDDDMFTFIFGSKLYILRLKPELRGYGLYRYQSQYLFAFGYSFWICDNAHVVSSGSRKFQHYVGPECELPKNDCKLKKNSIENEGYFGGPNFRVRDLEVYKIMD